MLAMSVYAFSPIVARAVLSPNAAADSYNMLEGASLTISAPGVLANDDDGDGGAPGTNITAALAEAPSIPGAFSLGNDGSISFTPTDPEYNGPVTFTYTVTDNDDFLTSTPATTTITVGAVNDTPTSANQSVTTGIDIATSSSLSATDTDSVDVLTFATTSDPTHGTLTLDVATGAFTYTPEASYVGSDSFTWQAFDGAASSSDATVSIVVLAEPMFGISFIVVSNNGVVATTSDTALFDGATTTGATTTTAVGSHTLSAIPLAGYTITISGDCAADGTVTLEGGESYHCVITYTQSGSPAPAAEEKKPANGPISDLGPFFGAITNFNGLVLGASTTAATTTLPELPVGCTPLLTGFFRRSMTEYDPEQVRKLQQFLNEKIGANVPLTGEFGSATDAAVRAFQLKFAEQILDPWGIRLATGFVYLTTQRWINIMSCSSLAIPMPELVPYHAG